MRTAILHTTDHLLARFIPYDQQFTLPLFANLTDCGMQKRKRQTGSSQCTRVKGNVFSLNRMYQSLLWHFNCIIC